MKPFRSFSLKNATVKTQLILSYLLIFAIPITACCVMYFAVSPTLKRELVQTNLQLVSQIQSETDTMLSSAFRTCGDIGKSAPVRALLSKDLSREELLSPAQSALTLAATQSLSQIGTANNFTSGYFIYFKDINCVVNATSAYKAETFYLTRYGSSGYGDWLTMLESGSGWRGYGNELVYLQPQGDGVIVVPIDAAYLENTLMQSYKAADISIFLADHTLGTVLSVSPAVAQHPLPGDKFKSKNGHFYLDGYTVFYAKTMAAPFYVGYLVRSSIMMGSYIHLLWIALTVFLLSILCGILLMVYFSRQNAKPVRELVQMLGSTERAQGYNEYDYIKQKTSHILTEKQEIEQQAARQTAAMQKLLFDKLLSGNDSGMISLVESLRQYNIRFPSEFFAVALFYLDTDAPANPQEVSGSVARAVDGVAQAFTYEFEHMLVSVWSLREKTALSAPQLFGPALEPFAGRAELCICVSSIQTGISNISAAYRSTLEILENRDFFRDTPILWYDEVQSQLPQSYYYPLDMEYALCAALKSGNYDDAADYLETIWEKNFRRGGNSYSRLILSNIAGSVLKAALELESSYSADLLGQVHFDEQALLRLSPGDAFPVLLDMFRGICEFVEQRSSTGKNTKVANAIAGYIKEHFTDPDLCVSSLGEQFGLTPYYLSRMFRDVYPDGVVTYIHTCRVELAAQLLQQGHDTVDQIAAKCGFTSKTTFMRVFKKITGTTPGSYQKKG